MSSMLSADSVGKRFGTTVVLRAASLSLDNGITYLVGRNGAGKTTLVSILMGVIEADSGIIHFRDQYLERPRWSSMARRGLAYLPADGFLPTRSRISTVLRGASRSREDYRRVLGQGGLEELANKKGAEVSTGERRLVELAWIALRRPCVVIADEPLQVLSPLERNRAMTLMRDLADSGSDVLVTGHESREILTYVDRVLWLHDGYVRDLGSSDNALQDPAFVAGYLGG